MVFPSNNPIKGGAFSPRRALDYANELLDADYTRLTGPVFKYLVRQLDDPDMRALWDEIDSQLSVAKTTAGRGAQEAALQAAKEAARKLISALETKLPTVVNASARAAYALKAAAIEAADQATLIESFGVADASKLRQVGVTWNRPDPKALAALDDIVTNPEFSKRVRGITPGITDRIFAGIFEGQGPLTTARQLRESLPQMTAYELNRLMRTTQLTSFRRATAETQRANTGLFAYQIRIEARDDRTCLACWALHGKKYPVGMVIDEHEQGRGRGIAVPIGKDVTIPTGPELWDKLPPERRRAIAGTAAFNAMEKGEARLADFVGRDHDPLWGDQIREKSVRELFGDETARKFYAANQGKPGYEFTPYRGTLDGAANNTEVAQWFRQHYPDLEYHIGMDMPADSVKSAVKEFDRLATKYPKVVAGMRGLATDDRGNFFGKEDAGWDAYASWWTNRPPHNGWIVYNADHFIEGDEPRPWKYGEYLIGNKTRWENVTQHEFGHHVHFWLTSKDFKEKAFVPAVRLSGIGRAEDTLNRWLEKWKPKISGLSGYGLTNKYELFAESFASVQGVPRGKWSTHTKRFNKMLEFMTDESNWATEWNWTDELARKAYQAGRSDEFDQLMDQETQLFKDIFEFDERDL